MSARVRPKILGVLNLSPESMVKESIAETPQAIHQRATALIENGADWIDLGGRSITPDVPMIGDQEEQRRLGSALSLLSDLRIKQNSASQSRFSVCVDTWSAKTGCLGLDRGAQGVNYTGGNLPDFLLERIAAQDATLFITFMPYENAYLMRESPPAAVGLQAVLDHLGPKVEAARQAGVQKLVIDPNLGIIHPTTDDHQKIHQQLEIIWNLDTLRSLACPILLYAARKPERLARIMMASASLHAGADYIRTHTPEMLGLLQGEKA